MEPTDHKHNDTPPGFFPLDTLERFQSFESQILTDVNYFLWVNQTEADLPPLRFLFFLELIFDDGESLLLTSGEDSEEIQISDAATLLKTAEALRKLHNAITIQRLNAGNLPLWQPVAGKMLEAIQLSKNEEGLYYNDALLLDFGENRILVRLSEKDGLEVGAM